ncbi:NADPH:quinone oxidoreductase family protein [Kribbia dieselivorans]|uniref:NADPH:quinone oxidoreductase family protein n=1 Tax=Kribbia dieselivorans TaxID=331526 RepID=UPI0008395876|nr:NADPH:quinone oxidoreductase family protein [Kribbia dieselivorans]
MRAIQVTSLDGIDAIEYNEIDAPTAGPNDVLIEVHAAGVSFPEVLQTRGEYQIKYELPFVPGAEVAGVVLQAPAGSPFTAGDRVAGFPGSGGYGQVVACPVTHTFALPENVTFAQGAALPMNYLTCHFALVRRGGLKAGETVLVHGAAGGIGTASIQLAKALGAGTVIAVASSEEKRQVALDAGADHAIDPDGFKDAVKQLTGGRGVDIVVDPVGGDRFTDSIRSLAPEGRILVIGFTGGSIPEVKVNRLLLTNTDVRGVGWGAFWTIGGPEFLTQQWAELLPLLESGAITPPIGAEYPLAEAAQALHAIDERRASGKLILNTRD